MSDSRMTVTCPICEWVVSLNDPGRSSDDEHRAEKAMRKHERLHWLPAGGEEETDA